MDKKTIEKTISAADNLAHVAAFVSGRLDVFGIGAKEALALVRECKDVLQEAASGYWKTKGTDEDGIPASKQFGIEDEVFPNVEPMIKVECNRCHSGLPTWSSDYEPLFTIRCKECNAHTKPALTPDIARHRWIFDTPIECGKYRE